jgi:hypothetical protein
MKAKEAAGAATRQSNIEAKKNKKAKTMPRHRAKAFSLRG